MKFEDIYSIQSTTKNQDGYQEITIEWDKGLFRTLFKLPRRKTSWVRFRPHLEWAKKVGNSYVYVDSWENAELQFIWSDVQSMEAKLKELKALEGIE